MKKIMYLLGLLMLLASLFALSGCGSAGGSDSDSSSSSSDDTTTTPDDDDEPIDTGSSADVTATRVAPAGEVAALQDVGDLLNSVVAADNWYSTRAADISDDGYVVGQSNNGQPVKAAYRLNTSGGTPSFIGIHFYGDYTDRDDFDFLSNYVHYGDYYGVEASTSDDLFIYSEAVSIHSATEIVGNSTTGKDWPEETEKRGFYSDGSTFIDLPPVPYQNDDGDWLMADFSEAVSVNEDYVLINSEDKTGRHAYYWNKTSFLVYPITIGSSTINVTIPDYRRLGVILNADSEAVAINANNQAIVNSGSTVVFHDLEATVDAIEELNGLPGATETIANDINDADVTGHVTGKSGNEGFFWDGGAMYPLGTLGGSESEGVDINNNDVIVGHSTLSNGHIHAFKWELVDSVGQMTDLGTLGGANSWAVAINDNGIVIGYSETGDIYTEGNVTKPIIHACAWYNGVIYDLGVHNDFYDYPFIESYPFSEAVAINEADQVTGHSYTINAHYRSFTIDLSPLTD